MMMWPASCVMFSQHHQHQDQFSWQQQPAATMPALCVMQPQILPGSRAGSELNEVLAAIESLYQDQLEPCGRILRMRLSERMPGDVDIDMKRVKAMCESCPWLCVETKDSRDWTALICNRERTFVDVYSPIDMYHPDLWLAAGAYFEGLATADMALPGGRYSCAKTLVSRSLPFLAGLSLGQICHVVQLAISQKRILGYLNGAVVPYDRSQSKIKDDAAEHRAQLGSGSRGVKVADWNLLICGMTQILADSSTAEYLPLSTIKRMFRSRFQAELSETALGHAKLSDLMQDLRLRNICTVELHGHCYVVTKLETKAAAIQSQTPVAAPNRQSMHLAAVQSAARAPVGQTPQAAVIHSQTPVAAPNRQSTPLAAVQSKARAPVGQVSDAVAGANAIAALLQKSQVSQVTPGQRAPATDSQPLSSLSARAKWVEPLDIVEGEPAPEASMPLMTPTPTAFGVVQHWHRNCVLDAHMWEISCRAIGLVPPCQNLQSIPSRERNSTVAESSENTRTASEENLITPGMLEQNGYSVINTFIHEQAAPPTPSLSSAAARSHSLPRNMGLANDAEKRVAVAGGKLAAHDAKQRRPGNRLMSAAAAAARTES
eukprot:TRINITY_DN2294_c0_g1_i1.p1 TRINITY_DN2294_c0_g1~~TRINITY_DN2294_c0_g1_i1.p1  ORF type:complete len:602 (+),score=105.40 TRINITY_DN2294_c0_g1_i1:71-1876(+)